MEHNKFCVSVHFRNCAPGAHEAVLGAVEVTLRAHAELHATRGRKVFEIRPQARGPLSCLACLAVQRCFALFGLKSKWLLRCMPLALLHGLLPLLLLRAHLGP